LTRLDLNLYPRKWCAWLIVAQFSGGFPVIPYDVADKIVGIGMVTERYAAKGRDRSLMQQDTRSTWRFNPRMTPMRTNISVEDGPDRDCLGVPAASRW
jgi:hypothetical protein